MDFLVTKCKTFVEQRAKRLFAKKLNSAESDSSRAPSLSPLLPILKPSERFVGRRRPTEFLFQNSGRGYMAGFLVGSFTGFMKSQIQNPHRSLRIQYSFALDRALEEASETAHSYAMHSVLYTLSRILVSKCFKHTTANENYQKCIRASISGALSGLILSDRKHNNNNRLLAGLKSATVFSLLQYVAIKKTNMNE